MTEAEKDPIHGKLKYMIQLQKVANKEQSAIDIDLDDLFDRFTAEIQQERQPPRRTISDEGANLLDEEQEGTMTPQDAAWLGDHEVIERDLRANNVVN